MQCSWKLSLYGQLANRRLGWHGNDTVCFDIQFGFDIAKWPFDLGKWPFHIATTLKKLVYIYIYTRVHTAETGFSWKCSPREWTWAWAGLGSRVELTQQAWHGGWLSRPPKCEKRWWVYAILRHFATFYNWRPKRMIQQHINNIWLNHWNQHDMICCLSPSKSRLGESPRASGPRASRRFSWGWRETPVSILLNRLFTGGK